ncbi:MAG: ATPase [Oscillospiraceae bacterium]|nr:ATPase [Oscillospiraceae bacterium]
MDMDMDVMEIIDMMEETITKASSVPLTGKIMLDKEELLDYIQEIRLVYPEALKEAKWVKTERQRILDEAEERADAIKKSAEETQERLVDEHEITRQAYEKAEQIRDMSERDSREIKMDTDRYVDEILADVEHRLDLLLRKVQEDREEHANS